jgi:hypothetical protein
MLHRKFTYANVIATIALFVALGGGAYAATQLPAKSVGTKQLKNGAVTKAKLGRSLQNSLGARGPAGPAGATGATGAEGREGKTGPRGERGERGEPGSAATVTPPGGTVPAGTTLRGAVAPNIQLPSAGAAGSGESVSFGGYQMPTRPVANVVPPGAGPTATCPGTVAAPEAAPGNLCVYVASVIPDKKSGQVIITDPTAPSGTLSGINFNIASGNATAFGDKTVPRFGFRIGWSPEESTIVPQLFGSWAVTA